MKLLIKQARVIDPANKLDAVRDVFVEQGVIKAVSSHLSQDADTVIDATGKILMPGFIDLHVHLREPGREDKETVSSGTQAAAKGGITGLLAMPNTEPAIDCAEQVGLLQGIIKRDALVSTFVAATISKNRQGKEISDLASLKKAGAIAITDDGSSVEDETVMAEALKRAARQELLVICHCQDSLLSKDGLVNRGFTATKLGLRGMSNESEYRRIARDIELARKTGARIHIAHVSCQESVEIIAEAKKKGIAVTAEATPHHFSLTEEAVWEYDTNMKMNPPLRCEQDRQSLIRGLCDGTIDTIASDHAPHTINDKAIEFDRAAFGVIGLETELAVAITELLKPGLLDWPQLIERMSLTPAQILRINRGTLSCGACADLVIVSADKQWTVEKDRFVSKSKNSCFLGRKLSGVVEYTIHQGAVVYRNPGEL